MTNETVKAIRLPERLMNQQSANQEEMPLAWYGGDESGSRAAIVALVETVKGILALLSTKLIMNSSYQGSLSSRCELCELHGIAFGTGQGQRR